MTKSKQAATPSEGIYYVLPLKDGHVTVLSQRADEVEEPAHMFFWDKVLQEIAHEYGLNECDVADIKTDYMSIPRGRVQKELGKDLQYTGRYVIIHGNDVPIPAISYAVLQDFGLVALSAQKKVIWKTETHEKMDPKEALKFKALIDEKMRIKSKKR